MNTTATTNTAGETIIGNDDNIIDGAVTEVKAPDNALVILNPVQFATELFQPFEDRLASLRRATGRAKYVITTKDGMAKAKELRGTAVKIRTEADKAKTAAKRPIDESGKLILAHYKKIEEAAKAEEARHDAAIAAEEKRLADEKQRKLDEERERVAALEAKVDALRQLPQTCAGLDSDQLRDAIAQWSNFSPAKADYQEYFEDAVIALEASVVELRKMLDNALKAEAAARQAEADRVELERLRAEQAQREADEAERKRKADEAAADSARQLAEQQAAMQLQQRRMEEIQRIQQTAMREGDARAMMDNLEYVQSIMVDADRFGDLASMAQMTKDMAITALQGKYAAQLAIEMPLAWDEALDQDAERIAIAGQAARTQQALLVPIEEDHTGVIVGAALVSHGQPGPDVHIVDQLPGGQYYSKTTFRDDGKPILCNADGTRSVFCDVDEGGRPENSEIIDLLAKHYKESPETILSWLRLVVKEAGQ